MERTALMIIEEISEAREAGRYISSDLATMCDEVVRLRKALEFYAKDHAIPSEGPWGINSDDFGYVAREALK